MNQQENIDPNIQHAKDLGGVKRKREEITAKSAPSLATRPTAASAARLGITKPAVGKATGTVPRTGLASKTAGATSRIGTTSKTVAPPAAKRAKATSSTASTASAGANAAKSSRPAWDIKGRLQDMENFTNMLQGQLNSLSTTLKEKEGQLETVSNVKETLQTDLTVHAKEVETMSSRVRELLTVIEDNGSKHRLEVDTLQTRLMTVQSRLDSAEVQLAASRSETDRLRFNLAQQSEQLESTRKELESTRATLKTTSDLSEDRARKIEELQQIIDSQKEQIEYLEQKTREDEDVRRKLHNQILELKGNIRVFCRVRPFLKSEEESDKSVQYLFQRNDDSVLDITSSANKDVTGCKTAPEKKFNWKFDKVFGPDSTQSKVFEEISQLVQSALDGYNTCIFAYGQTGSGKYDKLKMTAHWTNLTTMLYRTFTMEGPPAAYLNNDTRGMISRAVEQIFLTSYKLAEKGWEYEMQASFVEIYNESVRDLLASKKANEDTKYEIKHDPTTGKTWVTNLTVVPVRSPERVEELLKLSSKNRAVGVTNMNERSSRSHSVFQLRLIGKNKHTDAKSEGILNLIDLAGSERLAQSGATGDRLKETQAINKSLSCLGDVIAALANKDKHIPYRNSKLTFLLQDSLGGNSKTLMFVNISPASSNLNESINSLRFASKVNACEIGTARSNTRVNLGE